MKYVNGRKYLKLQMKCFYMDEITLFSVWFFLMGRPLLSAGVRESVVSRDSWIRLVKIRATWEKE
jgi:hypothetical protein